MNKGKDCGFYASLLDGLFVRLAIINFTWSVAMSDVNPYQAPTAVLTEPSTAGDLASLGSRFLAAMVDGVLSCLYTFPLMSAFGLWGYSSRGLTPPFGLMLSCSIVSILIYLLIHGYFLYSTAQSLGKKMLGIQIVTLDGKPASLPRILIGRLLPVTVVTLIPVIGPFLSFVDVIFIFGKQRRCLHDLIAGTRVVMASKPSLDALPVTAGSGDFSRE